MNARRTRRRKHPPHTASHERWLVSYADFITLLFAFFTTMYAISTVDARKLTSMVDSMQEAFDTQGVPVPGKGSAAPRPAPVKAAAMTTEMRERALAQLLRDRLDGRAVDVEIDHRGIVVSMREAGSFPTGSADLSAAARDVLSELAETLGAETAMTLRVEGHTDDVPIQAGPPQRNDQRRADREAVRLPRKRAAAGHGRGWRRRIGGSARRALTGLFGRRGCFVEDDDVHSAVASAFGLTGIGRTRMELAVAGR